MATATEDKEPKTSKNGSQSKRSSTIEVISPATGRKVGEVPNSSPADIKAAITRARSAQPIWEAMGFEGRARIFLRAQKWFLDNSDRIVNTILDETGKTYEDAQLVEIGYVADAFGFWAKHAEEYLADEKIKSENLFVKGRKLVVRYRPVGVVGVIGPWNFPLTNSFGDCLPALAAGNSVVLKPSEVTPLSSLLMVEMMAACGMPEDVFQVVTGDGQTGSALVDEVDFVMFTGSTATGKKVMTQAAQTLTPVSLELGGKDPMIVLADAEVERAANAATYYSMNNAGQICISVERVYVEDAIYDDFVGRVTEKVKALRQGPSTGPGSIDVGAVIFPPQLDIIKDHVQDATDKGARILTGGHAKEDGGRFYEPTVIVDVDHTMKCMTEETFGPTLPIMRVHSAEEAVQLANDSQFGLQASVWTKDVGRGEAIAAQLESGVTCINDAQMNYAALEIPMGGWKQSGLGSRHGAGGIRKYTRQQTLLVNRWITPRKDVHMFPNSATKSRLFGRLLNLMYGRGKRD